MCCLRGAGEAEGDSDRVIRDAAGCGGMARRWSLWPEEHSGESNTNTESVVRYDLQHSVVARYLRFVPLDWNGEGQIGLRIEVYGCPYWADVINFDGNGVISYRFKNKKMKTLKDVISLKFKTSESEGVIFHGEGQQGDYITLELKKAKLTLQLNLGSNQYGSIYGHTSVTTGSLLDDHHWHSVVIERYGRNINLTLDRHMQHFRTNGEFDHLDLDYENSSPETSVLFEYLDQKDENYKGSSLNDGQWHEVRFQAKENFAMLTIDGDEASAVRTNSPIQIKTGNQYYFGGYMRRINASILAPTLRSFQGCMQLIYVDNQLVDLHSLEQRKVGSFENISIDMCAIIDRCLYSLEPNWVLVQEATPSMASLRCLTDRLPLRVNVVRLTHTHTHFEPAPSQAIYEQSCEAYKHLGKTSDSYWIDPDGSGPLGHFKVYCNMTDDKVWTTIIHDLQPQTSVSGSTPEKPKELQLNYSASMDQISAVTFSAEHCEQHISYSCRMSRLLNTPDGTPYTWWVGKGNEKQYYWGGSAPGIQKCACGIERNCTDPRFSCNCDADNKQWRKDTGLLSYKEHLPVSQLIIGDTSRSGSEAKLAIGPLRCQGDRNYWNAASFNTPSSYLHFSTFQGETSADISFYFKTSATYGVFLENLGNADFIRLELKSPTYISFSFDVGNGPVELLVRSLSPLNDDQWHHVVAERNIKQASLQLDHIYKEVRQAPAQGHTRLELYSQLYVGAAGGHRGFLGCIRSLKMNGITLDLEERAKVTPGVNPGCSGHCTSYGMYCQNGGTCVEKYNGYSCNCSKTAFDGPFCTKDVGAFFEAGTWIKYSIPQPPIANLTREDLSLSFSTTNTPSILMYIGSHIQDYIAVVLRHNGTLQIRYNLGGMKEAFKIDLDHRNVANGQPHSLNISRHKRDIQLQLDHYPPVNYTLPEAADIYFNLTKTLFLGRVVETGKLDPELIQKYNTPGFVGCLSRVQFNQIAPLKAALGSRSISPVHIQGELVESNCGASPLTIPPMSAATDPWHLDSASPDFPLNEERVIPDGVNRNSAIIGGVIAVVIFTILCTLVFLIRYMFRHKGTYHTNEAKGAECADNADAAIMSNDPNFTETIDESKKEWFI
ncbi:CNTP2 protein, partial [Polypterus senegalus]